MNDKPNAVKALAQAQARHAGELAELAELIDPTATIHRAEAVQLAGLVAAMRSAQRVLK